MPFRPASTAPMDPDLASLLTQLVEKAGLLRHDLNRKGDLEKYEARVARIDAMLAKLAEYVAAEDEGLGKDMRTAGHKPGRSLAFRNVDHQKKSKEQS